MLKRVYYYKGVGGLGGDIELELYLNISRELTDNDERLISELSQDIVNGVRKETISLDENITLQVKEEKDKLIELFGDKKIFVEEIENGYNKDSRFKWFIVTTNKGRIKIGWRKRVINIDWSDSVIKENGETLFFGEESETTVGKDFIHAWGYEKAKEYINKLLN